MLTRILLAVFLLLSIVSCTTPTCNSGPDVRYYPHGFWLGENLVFVDSTIPPKDIATILSRTSTTLRIWEEDFNRKSTSFVLYIIKGDGFMVEDFQLVLSGLQQLDHMWVAAWGDLTLYSLYHELIHLNDIGGSDPEHQDSRWPEWMKHRDKIVERFKVH